MLTPVESPQDSHNVDDLCDMECNGLFQEFVSFFESSL